MTPDSDRREQVHALWDALAEFDAAQMDTALECLMRGLCTLVDAQNAGWIGAVRLVDPGNEPASGWRPAIVRFLHPFQRPLDAARAQTLRMDRRFLEAAVGMVARSARFRACRLCEIVSPGSLPPNFQRACETGCDDDAICVAFPLNADAQSCLGVFRGHGCPAFTPQERDLVAYALRGIKWFHRELLLSRGLLVAGSPLTEIERRALQGLLSGQMEEQIAADIGESHRTARDHVTAVYRKFAVKNRPALMALWLGTPAR